MDANDLYLQGLAVLADPGKFTPDGAAEARSLFEQAIGQDSGFSLAHAELAYLEARAAQNEWSGGRIASLRKAESHANDALAITDDFNGHWSRAIVYWNQGKFDESFKDYGAARQHNPNEPDLDADEAEALIYAGVPGKAITQIKEAMGRKPDGPYWYRWNLARAYYMTRQYQKAIDTIGEIPNPPKEVLLITAASYAQLENLPAAEAAMAEFRAYDPDWTQAKSAAYPYRNNSDRDHWLDGLQKAGLP